MMESNFKKCKICNEYHYLDKECNPIFYFKHGSWGNEFQEIRAFDFEDAAEKFSILYNEDGDYPLMDNEESVIISDGKEEKEFKVSAETDIRYYVDEVE